MPQGDQVKPDGVIEGPLLPPGLVWVDLLGPVALTLIMSKELHATPLSDLLRDVA